MPSQLDHYVCIRTLGAGISAKVKLATDSRTEQRVAIKIFDKSDEQKNKIAIQTFQTELEALSILKHPYTVKVIDFKEDSVYTKSNGDRQQVAYIVLELITGGELFDFVVLEYFHENICRLFFKQMLSVIHFAHSEGISHRDLKPENILLDDQFNVRVSDFGFAAPVEGRNGYGYLLTKTGTKNYMAPELLTNQPYRGHVVDLFALGIILFIMYSGRVPFNLADPVNDPRYKHFANDKTDLFWQYFEL